MYEKAYEKHQYTNIMNPNSMIMLSQAFDVTTRSD